MRWLALMLIGSQQSRLVKFLVAAVAAFLLLAVWSRWPYAAYRILRVSVCATATYLAVRSYGLRKQPWVWIMGTTAAIFNPFVPLRLPRSQWQVLDFGAVVVFALWAWKIGGRESEEQQSVEPSPTPCTALTEQQPKSLAPVNETSPGRKIKVLVCDDEPAVADLIAETLGGEDCETAIEYSGIDAVYRAATFRPDVALIGFVMPQMDGVEAGVSLLKISPKTKIVLITEPVPSETLETMKAHGYNFDAFPAPFTAEELRAMIFVWSCE